MGYAFFLTGVIISLFIGIIAFKADALTKSGTIAAILVGISVFYFGGLDWFLLMSIFFITSMILSRIKNARKEEANKDFAKGGVRDFWQVTANGAIAALSAIAFFFYKDSLFFYSFVAAVSTMTFDTWATEAGILGKSNPFLVTSGKRVRIGTSGAVSLQGTLIGLLGSVVIGVCAYYFFTFFNSPLPGVNIVPSLSLFLLVALAGGFFGSLADSLLGASVQRMYYCTRCKKETECKIHYCSHKTTKIRGIDWFDNDFVNLLASLVGALVGVIVFLFLG